MTPKASHMDTYFVYCKGTRELLQDRIAKRKNHFMGAKVSPHRLHREDSITRSDLVS